MTHIPKILIKTIDPANQRFKECGDWFYDADDDTLTIFINKMPDWKSEIAVAIHEFIEAVMCLDKGIDQTDVDYFDKNFYKTHNDGQAGDDDGAPYFKQHESATKIEKEVCAQLQLSWDAHSRNCDDL
jgi:hypothetical protein